ncbi:MAG TPA: carboxypeptidase regulatory-like domain-containing protein [Vicinamibacterales bacterium]|nr:carboxypeptidase regulatory-like domain-containing protein [Vicinamibacterales bacterium]
MRTLITIGILATLTCAALEAAENLWTISIVGGHEITLPVRQAGDVPTANVLLLARDLELAIDQRDDRVVIRDASGVEWHIANGSVLLEGPQGSRALDSPAVIAAGSVFLPLTSIAELAGRKLVVDRSRAMLLPVTSVRSLAARAPTGWDQFQIKKTDAELKEMRRLEGTAGDSDRPLVRESQPPAHESLSLDVGLGIAQGLSGAADVLASGSAEGIRINLNAFLTYGADGVLVRNGRLTLQDPAGTWSLEAGDVLSDVRGAARGIRLGRALRPWWRPSVALYVHSAALSATDQSAIAYRDDLQLPFNVSIRGEAISDRSSLLGIRWLQGRFSIDTFSRYTASRGTHDHGASVSYDLWRGITAQAGARLSTGAADDRWYFGGVTVPVAKGAAFTLERTRSGLQAADTSAFGLQLPIGKLRIMQRYQWTDIGFVREPAINATGGRQLQSMASYSPVRRVQLSYQVATQWTASAIAKQWTELQTVFTISRATSLHAVTGFPDIASPERFRFGLQQNLAHGFRLAIDYGRLPAFQTTDPDAADHARLLVMVRRTFAAKTPARGTEVRGKVVDPRGEPVPGAPVTLGPYVTTAAADGSYRFSHVPTGTFDLGLDTLRLSARYASDGVRQHLDLTGARKTVDLHAVPLHAIHGHVYIDRNGNGQFDADEGIPNVVLRLSQDEFATMTDEGGAYGFYNLPPGSYQVWIDAARVSRDLRIVSSGSIEVQLDEAGQSSTGVDLQVAVKEKPIVMQKSLPQ